MGWLLAAGIAALARSVAAQTTSYTDSEGRTFSGFADDAAGVLYGFAIPQSAAEGESYDVIVQITAPIEVGWAGLTWGGSMTYSPLTIAWANDDEVVVSSRMAFGYSAPGDYEDATLTLLPGSGVNDTHFYATALCSGCTYWAPLDSEPTSLDPAGENVLGWAYSTVAVDSPGEEDSSFSIHEGTGQWSHDFSEAQHEDFEEWADEAEDDDGDGGVTSSIESDTSASGPSSPPTEVPSSVSNEPSTTEDVSEQPPSSSPSEEEPPPGVTGTDPLPVPSACPGVGDFASGFDTAEGWRAVKLAGGLTTPRGIVLDTNGNLLVVQSGFGITAHTFGADGCIASNKTLIENPTLNHGIGLTEDGATLYVTSMTTAYEYSYDADAQEVGDERTVVSGMIQGGHPTRTLIVPPQTPNLLVISLGSYDNLDHDSLDPATGRAIVKVFDMTDVPDGGYDYNTEGYLLGYGLRNGVALAADGNNHIWEVENGADEFERTPVNGDPYDIHSDNPAEELNYLGDPSVENSDWYGYPTCHSVYGDHQFNDTVMTPGDQFVLTPNDTFADADCADTGSVPARLNFQAHSAPMDAAFDQDYENLFITFHGSWNRPVATGYKIVQVAFTQNDGLYDPVEPPSSSDAAVPIFWSENEGECTSSTCFRPCGLVFDSHFTRLFVASDRPSDGELFMLARV